MTSHAEYGIAICVLFLSSLAILQGAINYIYYRHVDVFKAQLPYLTLPSIIVMCLRTIEVWMHHLTGNYTCHIRAFSFVFSLLAFIIYSLKCFQFWFRFEYANECLMYFRSEIPNGGTYWFRDHRKWANDAHLSVYFISITLLFFTLTLPSSISRGSEMLPVCRFYRHPGPVLCVVICLSGLIFGLLLAFKLRGSYDSLGIKSELVASFVLIIFGMFVAFGLIIAAWTKKISSDDAVAYNNAISSVIMLLYIYMLCYKPHIERLRNSPSKAVREAYSVDSFNRLPSPGSMESSKTSRESRNSVIGKLPAFLSHAEGYEAFERHLIGEFCVESLQFWKQVVDIVETYKGIDEISLPHIETLTNSLISISGEFLSPTSEFEVNLGTSKVTTLQLIARLAKETVFSDQVETVRLCMKALEACASEIFRHLSMDSFLRFSRGKVYKVLSSKFAEEALSDLQCKQGLSVALMSYDSM